jgi:hypothetical protein
LLARLVDDAALFAPGHEQMSRALRDYLGIPIGEVQAPAATANGQAGVVGGFLCPVSRLPEMITELTKVKLVKPVPLALVIDNGMGGVPKAVSIVESRTELLDLRAIEMPAPSDVDEVWLERVAEFVPEDVARIVEPRRGGEEWLDGVKRVLEAGYRPKIRCGGPRKENYPSIDEVADFLSVVINHQGSFKATSGLHNPVRGTEETSDLEYHGFLNLMVATARALSGRDVRDALASTDAAALVQELADLTEPAAAALRSVFISYGTHETGQPIADLKAFGLL